MAGVKFSQIPNGASITSTTYFIAAVDVSGVWNNTGNKFTISQIKTAVMPNLNEVLNKGATSDQTLTLENSGQKSFLSANGLGVYYSNAPRAALVCDGSGAFGYVQFRYNTRSATIQPSSSMSGNVVLTMGNTTGTIAITADIDAAVKKATVTLVAGVATISDAAVSTNTIAAAPSISVIGGTVGAYYVITYASGTITITSKTALGVTQTLDTSTLKLIYKP